MKLPTLSSTLGAYFQEEEETLAKPEQPSVPGIVCNNRKEKKRKATRRGLLESTGYSREDAAISHPPAPPINKAPGHLSAIATPIVIRAHFLLPLINYGCSRSCD